jgi:hypothetical protein
VHRDGFRALGKDAEIGFARSVALHCGNQHGGTSEPESRDRLLKRRAGSWLISFVILALFPASSAAAETNRVLMLFSNDSLLPAGNAVSWSFGAA